MKSVVGMSALQMGRAVIMPNLSPPIINVSQAIDYHKEIVDRAGDNWDGTLISKDGVHPSGPVKGEGTKFTEENLKKSGYMLRTYLCFAKFREVYFKALGGK